jgi:hypothetical protein
VVIVEGFEVPVLLGVIDDVAEGVWLSPAVGLGRTVDVEVGLIPPVGVVVGLNEIVPELEDVGVLLAEGVKPGVALEALPAPN